MGEDEVYWCDDGTAMGTGTELAWHDPDAPPAQIESEQEAMMGLAEREGLGFAHPAPEGARCRWCDVPVYHYLAAPAEGMLCPDCAAPFNWP